MCVYGIGLPFDHPIWLNLPPCRCGWESRPDPFREYVIVNKPIWYSSVTHRWPPEADPDWGVWEYRTSSSDDPRLTGVALGDQRV